MITWGISSGGHDAAIAVLKDGDIAWAAHSERYSRVKNCDWLDDRLVQAALAFGEPDRLIWHERPWLRRTRELYAGQWRDAVSPGPRAQLAKLGLQRIPLETVGHHRSHAAGGYFTSGFSSAAILVVDAMGEWETLTAWHAVGNELRKIRSVSYPNSLGLFYAAMTQRCGFKPNEEEYIMMGLSALGDGSRLQSTMSDDIIEVIDQFPFFRSLANHHRGVRWWSPEVATAADIAAAAQDTFTAVMLKLSTWLRETTGETNLVLSGGCALNCVTNTEIARQKHWDSMWIMPNPGDAGNSLGAALAVHEQQVPWTGPYLGHRINGVYPVEQVLAQLVSGNIVGVANGRAEFGPRALGNRSLLADPRRPDIKHQMNAAKQREEFRPFAPVILAEHAGAYFEDIGQDLSYMQHAVRCLRPSEFPGIVHRDGTSRVQTVSATQNPGLHRLLRRWHAATGCPMLVNTSLNIKGQPMVNDEADARSFSYAYGIPVYTAA